MSAFNKQMRRLHVVLEFEFDESANGKACMSSVHKTLPVNDILDLCIKSRFKKTLKNSNVPFDLD